MARTIITLIALCSLSACATTQDVVPIGHGNYELAGSSVTAFSSGGAEKIKLLRIANQYCAQQGKQATMLDGTQSNGTTLTAFQRGGVFTGRHATADVVFQCQ